MYSASAYQYIKRARVSELNSCTQNKTELYTNSQSASDELNGYMQNIATNSAVNMREPNSYH